MGKQFLITEEEKSRILGLYNEKKIINEQTDLTAHASNKANYPPCVQSLGNPIKITPDPETWFNHAIKGTGALKGYMFYPYMLDNNYKSMTDRGFWVQKPNTTGKDGRVQFTCSGKNAVVIEGKTYPTVTRVVPTTVEQLSKGGYFLKLNDKNDLVKRVQQQLISAGEDVVATGTFDQQTKDAVISFQSKQTPPLKTDGVVGKNTWNVLSKAQAQTIASKQVTSIPTDNSAQPELKPQG